MLILPIKKKWFDMILSGEKKEEYREIKPYYTTRFCKYFPFKINSGFWNCDQSIIETYIVKNPNKLCFDVIFRNGYSANSPSFMAKVSLSIGAGSEEWGAEKDKEYFILTVQEILNGSED